MEGARPTVLVVDDDPEILGVLQEHLTGEGFRVITATNGVEAFLQVWRQRPRAVVLDLFMPRLGGLGALDRIKRLDSSIVIIMISGVPNALEMVTEAGVSVAGVFSKPFDPAQLVGLLVQAGVAPARTPGGAPSRDVAPEARRPTRKRVLVVDDEPEFAAMLVGYLQGKGFEVLGAGGGEEALRRIAEFRPQVVLLDIAMPGLSGVETLRRIKALPQETCVVMVSAIEDVETARRTLALGASDYVQKPVDFAYLGSVLEAHTLMAQFGPEST